MACRFCDAEIEIVNDFGDMPIANGFYSTKDQDKYRFNLKTAFCKSCKLFQIIDQPIKELMFHQNYPFFTGLSNSMSKHFHEMVMNTIKVFSEAKKPAFIVEIGCNDGTLLEKVKQLEIKHLGIDPSANVISRAVISGINAEVDFFDYEKAVQIKKRFGSADIIFAANVICHLPNVRDLAKGIKELLSPDGIFVFEEPYLGSMLEKTSFDQIYDEHVYIFSLNSVKNVFESVGLELFDALLQETHGGSMRYFIANKDTRRVTNKLESMLDTEVADGFNSSDIYREFDKKCILKKDSLLGLLTELKANGKLVGGYAATSKSTTLLNYCNIDSSLVSFICDSTPEKIGKYSPGSNIPIISTEAMRLTPPDFLLLFGWNHEKEIMQKESNNLDQNVKWIKYVPEVEVVKF
jgi:methylation protein EvaC